MDVTSVEVFEWLPKIGSLALVIPMLLWAKGMIESLIKEDRAGKQQLSDRLLEMIQNSVEGVRSDVNGAISSLRQDIEQIEEKQHASERKVSGHLIEVNHRMDLLDTKLGPILDSGDVRNRRLGKPE